MESTGGPQFFSYRPHRPQELDEAARRRLVKRLYIPLPDSPARATIVRTLMASQTHSLSDEDIGSITTLTDGV